MAKLVLPDIGTLSNQSSAREAMNENFDLIEEAVENTLSRDGTTPNQMEADIDMNSNSVINVADPVADGDAVNKRSVGDLVDFYVGQIAETLIEGTARVDIFTATASQTSFALSDPPSGVNAVFVFDDGVAMVPGVDFTLTGATLQTLEFFVGRTVGHTIVARYVQLSPADSLLRADLATATTNKGSELIAFAQDDAEATQRTVHSRLLSLPINALDFIPQNLHADILDGTSTDDVTVYLQYLIDLVGSAGGGRIELGNGLFNISATLDVPYSNVIISGNGCGGYSADGIATVRASGKTRIAWTGAAPASGTPMVDFRTPSTLRAASRSALRDVMLDGMTVAKVGLTLTSYSNANISDVFVYACVEDGFLFRTAAYNLVGGAGACQFNTLTRCAVASYGGSGVYLTNECKGIRFTGPKFGASGGTPAQSGDSSHNTVYSPRFDLAKGVAITFEAVGQNNVFAPQGGAWGGVTGGYDIVFGSTDQDTNWPPSAGVAHANSATSRHNTVYFCEHAVVAKASNSTGGGSSFGNMVWGASRGNGAPDPWIEQSTLSTVTGAKLVFQTIGSQTATSRTVLGGHAEVVGYDNTSAVSPAFFLKKNSDVGTAGDGLAKIQWRMTNDAGTIDIDAGRWDASIVNAAAGTETVAHSFYPQFGGNGEAQLGIRFCNGVNVPDTNAPNLAFQGFGTVNISVGYYVDNVKVVGPRDTGWTAMTGTANEATSYATGTITLIQLAERVKALQDALATHGLIGA